MTTLAQGLPGAMETLRYKLVFMDVGGTGDLYPETIRRLRPKGAWRKKRRGASGVYVIRCKESKRVLYVGESHTGRLYETLRRHFAAWNDRKGHHGGAHKWHIQYPRAEVEVAVRKVRAGRAVDFQDRLIYYLNPRDNRDRPEVPF